jgi:hypothetical protein
MGQGRVESIGDLARILKVNQNVVVTDSAGRKTRGKFAEASSSSLVILTKKGQGTERLTIAGPDVGRVTGTNPIWDGAVKGGAVGLILVGLGHLSCNGCSGVGGAYAGIGLMSAGIGLGIDAAFGARTFYRAPEPKRSFRITPFSDGKRHGVVAVVRF